MARGSSFNSVVAARTLAAAKILNTPELLTQFETLGGLKADLEAVVTHGRDAEALNQSQGTSSRDKSAAADRSMAAFRKLQEDYAAIMVVVKALRAELTNEGDKESLKKLQAIIKNEAQTAFTVAALEDGVAFRRRKPLARRSRAMRSRSSTSRRSQPASLHVASMQHVCRSSRQTPRRSRARWLTSSPAPPTERTPRRRSRPPLPRRASTGRRRTRCWLRSRGVRFVCSSCFA